MNSAGLLILRAETMRSCDAVHHESAFWSWDADLHSLLNSPGEFPVHLFRTQKERDCDDQNDREDLRYQLLSE